MLVMEISNSLINAVKHGTLRRVRELVNKGSHVELADCDGWTSIHHAAALGRLDVLQFLLGTGSRTCTERLSRRTWLKETPLIVACNSKKKTNADVIHYMLISGADVNAKNIEGLTPLHFACQKRDNLKVIKLLIDMGADVTSSAFNGSVTPVYFAIIRHLETEAIQYLLSRQPVLPINVSLCFMAIDHYEILPSIIRKIERPLPVALIDSADSRDTNPVTPITLLLQADLDPVYYFRNHGRVCYHQQQTFKEIFYAVPSRNITCELLEAILRNSPDVNTNLSIILQRLYDEEIELRANGEEKDFSPEMRLLASRYNFVTSYDCPSLMQISRKAALIYLKSKLGNYPDSFDWISNSKLPKVLKEYLLMGKVG